MRIWVSAEPDGSAWTINHEGVLLNSEDSIERWRTLLLAELDRVIGDRAVPLLINLHGFELHPAYSSLYGPVAKSVVAKYATHAVRFSPYGDFTSIGIHTAAIENRFPSNLCDSKATALALLERLVAEHPAPAPAV